MAGLFQLPPGYTIAGGTSTATPTAAGAVALLISAAKQTGVRYDPFRIRHAMTTSARYVPHLPAHKQGNGVVNIGGAWETLRALDTARVQVSITSSASVQHPYSHLLPTPHQGVGLYERDRWSVGDVGERTITFTRTSGPREAMTFNVSWTGDDSGTFSAPPSVTLPLNTPVTLTVGVAPKTHGAHTALLTLTHAAIPGYAYRTLVTVIAPQVLVAADSFTIVTKTQVPRPGMQSFFYRVPEGVSALQVAVQAPKRNVSLAVIRPDTRAESGDGPQSENTVVVTDPMPGTWEVRLSDIADTRVFDWEQAKKPEVVPATEATLTVVALAADVSTQTEAPMWGSTDRATATFDLRITNRMAPYRVSGMSTPMGSARRDRPIIREREQHVYVVDVPPGSTYLLARAFQVSDPAADIDVYVFDCTGKRCRRPVSDADPIQDESVLVRQPASGTWKIVVDAFAVPSGSTSYEYLDVVFNPSYGMLAVTDLPDARKSGAEWTTTAHAWVTPAATTVDRTPYAAVMVQAHPKDGEPFLVAFPELTPRMATETGAARN